MAIPATPRIVPAMTLASVGGGCRHHGCPGPKNANASRSRRRMTPLSRSDPVLRFVRLRQRFVRWSHGPLRRNFIDRARPARSEQLLLSFSSNRFLIRELHLGKLSETVIIHGNAPHNRSRFLVSHLIGNRASFLCTKAPMLRGHDKLSRWHAQCPARKSALEQRSILSWICLPFSIVRSRDQTHTGLDSNHNGGNDHQVMVLPC